MLKANGNSIAQDINMAVKPWMIHLRLSNNKFEACVRYLNHDDTLNFLMQDTTAEGNVII